MQRPATERSPLLSRTRGAARWLDRLRANRTALAAFAGAALLVAAVFALRRETSAPAPAAALADDLTEFDVIVVGGGPAGSVVAKLLSDDPWRRVLLIEAGDASQVELGGTHRINATANTANLTPFDVPFYWTSVANTPSLHWDYPDVNVAKALGGCGIHNAMLYVRALPSDLSRWNMPEWTWEKALEIYMRMESFDGPNVSYHGTRGSVRTSPPPPPDPLSEAFVQACEDAGLPRTVDFNAPSGRHGAGFYHFNTRGGIRESAARRFLGPILKAKRENFKLQLKTHVKRVILNDDLAATGVEIVNAEGSQQTLKLTKTGQVIITAGAINTPKLLLLSGLGHREDLAQLGIPVKKHLARVGMNLQDHPVLAMTFESPEAVKSIDLESAMDMYLKATQDPAANASSYGMMGSAGISAGAFLTSPGATIPDIQLTFFPRKSEPHVSNSSQLNHDPQILITVALLDPSARNRIVLTNVNGTDDITPRVISEVPDQEAEHLRPDDVRKLAWGVGVVREITAALARKGVVGREIWPGSSVVSEDDLLKWVPSAVFRNSHWVGSAAMGHNDETGVVDSHLRVFGVRNLRVADASVIPKIPNGNVHSSVLMVASHAVQLIREEEQR